MLTIVLVDPQIPANTGNIARLCTCTNSKLILTGELGFFITDKHLKRAGLDYWDELDFEYIRDPEDVFNQFAHRQRWLVTTKAKKLYTEADFSSDDVLIFGSETKGLPEDLIYANYEHSLRIPMASNKRSLNLSNSVSIVLYEALRQSGNLNLE